MVGVTGAAFAANAQAPRLAWVDARGGEVPAGAIVGGWEQGRTLYVCRGVHEGGLHPGKVVGAYCNIGWGGTEVLTERYEVLIGDTRRIGWVDSSYGGVPPGAFSGGYEPGQSELYVCRVGYLGGVHPGKIVGTNCNITYGGRELPFNRYQVLVSR